MDKDRVVGPAKVVKGKVKEAVGHAKLEAEEKADKIEGKIQSAVGGLKDAIKGNYRHRGLRDAFPFDLGPHAWSARETRLASQWNAA